MEVLASSADGADVSQKPSPSVMIYDDPEIRVIYRPGTSDYLLVTFGALDRFAEGNKFFAEAPVDKADIACIGFMAKQAHWYPEAATTRAIREVEKISRTYKAIVTYGASMGGYAAIKYSAALGSECTIALCPQWSIDKEECEGVDPGWRSYFSPKLRGMSIKPADIAGRIVVVSDPYEPTTDFIPRKSLPSAGA